VSSYRAVRRVKQCKCQDFFQVQGKCLFCGGGVLPYAKTEQNQAFDEEIGKRPEQLLKVSDKLGASGLCLLQVLKPKIKNILVV
jgi:hypothetical protein